MAAQQRAQQLGTSNAELANRKRLTMLSIRTALLLVTYLLLTACVISPLSRTNAESSNAVTLKGYTLSPGGAIVSVGNPARPPANPGHAGIARTA